MEKGRNMEGNPWKSQGFKEFSCFFFMTFPPASELLRDFMGSRIPTSMNDGIVQDKSG